MSRPHIFITRQIPDKGITLLKEQGYELEIYKEDQAIPRKELLARVRGCDALLPLLTDKIDEDVLKAAGPQLKVIANYAVGFDNIDLVAAKKYQIPVTNTPVPEMSDSVAEHAFALMIGLAHRIVEADAYTRSGSYAGWSPTMLLGTDLQDKTLGIIGLGRIGHGLAQRAVNGFGMHCLYHNPHRDLEIEKELGARGVSLETLLEESDFISIHVPLLPSTKHLISTGEFALMKKEAFLINTSRGPVVDEKALLRALKTKRIAGAALDVYECEPAIDCDIKDNLALKSFPNVILTPHTASATVRARQAMSRLAAENIIAVLSGRPALTPAK